MQITAYSVIKFKKYKLSKAKGWVGPGRTHGAPYRDYGYVPLWFGGSVVRRMGTQQQRKGGWVRREEGTK